MKRQDLLAKLAKGAGIEVPATTGPAQDLEKHAAEFMTDKTFPKNFVLLLDASFLDDLQCKKNYNFLRA